MFILLYFFSSWPRSCSLVRIMIDDKIKKWSIQVHDKKLYNDHSCQISQIRWSLIRNQYVFIFQGTETNKRVFDEYILAYMTISITFITWLCSCLMARLLTTTKEHWTHWWTWVLTWPVPLHEEGLETADQDWNIRILPNIWLNSGQISRY